MLIIVAKAGGHFYLDSTTMHNCIRAELPVSNKGEWGTPKTPWFKNNGG